MDSLAGEKLNLEVPTRIRACTDTVLFLARDDFCGTTQLAGLLAASLRSGTSLATALVGKLATRAAHRSGSRRCKHSVVEHDSNAQRCDQDEDEDEDMKMADLAAEQQQTEPQEIEGKNVGAGDGKPATNEYARNHHFFSPAPEQSAVAAVLGDDSGWTNDAAPGSLVQGMCNGVIVLDQHVHPCEKRAELQAVEYDRRREGISPRQGIVSEQNLDSLASCLPSDSICASARTDAQEGDFKQDKDGWRKAEKEESRRQDRAMAQALLYQFRAQHNGTELRPTLLESGAQIWCDRQCYRVRGQPPALLEGSLLFQLPCRLYGLFVYVCTDVSLLARH